MKENFIDYNQALALKKLGFSDFCFAGYDKESKELWIGYLNEGEQFNRYYYYLAPVFSQAFKFIREKYNLIHSIQPEYYETGINYCWQITWYLPKEEWSEYIIHDGTGLFGDNGEYATYEKAEIACLNNLIKICKI